MKRSALILAVWSVLAVLTAGFVVAVAADDAFGQELPFGVFHGCQADVDPLPGTVVTFDLTTVDGAPFTFAPVKETTPADSHVVTFHLDAFLHGSHRVTGEAIFGTRPGVLHFKGTVNCPTPPPPTTTPPTTPPTTAPPAVTTIPPVTTVPETSTTTVPSHDTDHPVPPVTTPPTPPSTKPPLPNTGARTNGLTLVGFGTIVAGLLCLIPSVGFVKARRRSVR